MKNKIQITDQLPIESTRVLTPEGYLKATAAITTVGVQQYPASDFGANTDERVGVYRPPETVFHPDTIESIKMMPITRTHPVEDVNSKNHGQLSVGTVGETVEPIDDMRLGASIIINEKAIVQDILNKKNEKLSLGYDSHIVSEEGEYNGEKYYYRFDGAMIVNHLAIVEQGRCGDTVKILDNGGSNMGKEQTKNDKIAFEDIDMEGMMPMIVKSLMPMIEKEIKGNKGFMATLAKEVATAMTAGSSEPEEEVIPDAEPEPELTPEEVATKAKEDAEEKEKKVFDAASVRAKLIDSAKPFVDAEKKIHDMKNREILEAALEKIIKVEDMKEKPDEYLQGVLDSITSDRVAAKDYFKQATTITDNKDLSQPFTGMQVRHLDEGGN